MEPTINDKKYIIHFKARPYKSELVNLSEYNNATFSIVNPTAYDSPTITTEAVNWSNLDITENGIGFEKNVTGYSQFITATGMSSYIAQDEEFTFYFRVKPVSGGLNTLTFDFYTTNFPGTVDDENSQYFKFGIYNGVLKFIGHSANPFNFEYDLADYSENKQYYIALTRNHNVLRAYIDGHKVYDSYDTGTDNSYKYGDPIFYDSVNQNILNVYIGCNTSNVKTYFDDITFCKGFAFYRYYDFEVPDDILAAKDLVKETVKTVITHSDTEFKGSGEMHFDTKFEYTVSVEVTNHAVKEIIDKPANGYRISTERDVQAEISNHIHTFHNDIVNTEITNDTEKTIICDVIKDNDTRRHIAQYQRKVLAFTINPIYTKRKGM